MYANVYASCMCMYMNLCACTYAFEWIRYYVELCIASSIKEMYNSPGMTFCEREYHYSNKML